MAKSFVFNPFTGNFDEISEVTLTAVGSTPNADGASVDGSQAITLQPADATHPGVITAADYVTFSGKQPAGNYITALTTDVAASGPGSVAATIQPNVVTNSKLAQMPTLTVKGNNTGGTANSSDLTVAQVNAILPVFTPTLNGLVPLSGGGTANFLRADGTFAAPPINGTVTSVSVTTANNVTGTVATATTTPAITLAPTSSTPTASSFVSSDANKNISANSFLEGYTTTATAAGTTTLVVGSTEQQYFTGVTTQTVLLPVVSTLVLGQSFTIVNLSTGVVTVQSSGGNTVQAMASGTQLVVTAILITGTTAASWNSTYQYGSSGSSSISIPNATAWASYTPTITGVGTATNVSFLYRQIADSYQVRGTFTTGTTAAALASLTLPNSAVLATQTITNTTANPGPLVGQYANNPTTQIGGVITATGTSTSLVYCTNPWPGTQPTLLAANGSSIFTSSTVVAVEFTVAISGLAVSTPVSVLGTATVAPTIQKFTSGSGTYTTPVSPRAPLYIRVRMVGGGGGGGGSSTFAANNMGAAGSGGSTTFGTALITCNGGGAGVGAGGGGAGAGGSASFNTPVIGIAYTGGKGSPGGANQTDFSSAGSGAATPFGGGGAGGDIAGAGNAATPNTGAGGGGGGGGTGSRTGGGGSAGGYFEGQITAPLASYPYAIGAAGTAGTAGTSGTAGGAGSSGFIEITEYYQ